MQGFSVCQHLDVLGDAAGARICLFRILDSIDHRKTVGAVEFGELLACRRIGRECVQEISRNLRLALRCLGSLPTAIGLRGLDLAQSGLGHASGFNETLG
jgi:hypothetical protein